MNFEPEVEDRHRIIYLPKLDMLELYCLFDNRCKTTCKIIEQLKQWDLIPTFGGLPDSAWKMALNCSDLGNPRWRNLKQKQMKAMICLPHTHICKSAPWLHSQTAARASSKHIFWESRRMQDGGTTSLCYTAIGKPASWRIAREVYLFYFPEQENEDEIEKLFLSKRIFSDGSRSHEVCSFMSPHVYMFAWPANRRWTHSFLFS